jgi:hypothetical protein
MGQLISARSVREGEFEIMGKVSAWMDQWAWPPCHATKAAPIESQLTVAAGAGKPDPTVETSI